MSQKDIYVYVDHQGWESLMGVLSVSVTRGEEIFSFEYDSDWLEGNRYHLFDPDLQFYQGPQYPGSTKGNFGLFLDSSPDRWGRVIMKRREAVLAKREGRPEKTLCGSDYLLGVYDENRMGALRFKLKRDGQYVNSDENLAAPPWTSMAELAQFSLSFEEEGAESEPDYHKWLAALIAPGSSLGGARPKASVQDTEGQLWIAKFPSRNDDYDMGAWESVANSLAAMVGLNTPEWIIVKFHNRHSTFITNRFDRHKGKRIHFASAMTMLGYTDGAGVSDGVSYLELVDFITTHGGAVDKDLIELFKRIVFNILTSNTDDHLRNHGFLLASKGWVLSPVYDLNPCLEGQGLSLNISETDNSLDLGLPLEICDLFRIKKNDGAAIIREMAQIVAESWQKVAAERGLSKTEISYMGRAFSRAKNKI